MKYKTKNNIFHFLLHLSSALMTLAFTGSLAEKIEATPCLKIVAALPRYIQALSRTIHALSKHTMSSFAYYEAERATWVGEFAARITCHSYSEWLAAWAKAFANPNSGVSTTMRYRRPDEHSITTYMYEVLADPSSTESYYRRITSRKPRAAKTRAAEKIILLATGAVL